MSSWMNVSEGATKVFVANLVLVEVVRTGKEANHRTMSPLSSPRPSQNLQNLPTHSSVLWLYQCQEAGASVAFCAYSSKTTSQPDPLHGDF